MIYVGKATSIRKRVAGHFAGKSPRGAEMVDQVALDRLPRHRDRGRGAARRAAVHQAPPAALQHPPARRQVLSRTSGSASTRSSRGSTSPASGTARGGSTSALLEGEAGARDARPARQAVPVPHLRGPRAGPPLRAFPASTTTSSAARRPASATSTARSTGATSRRSSTSSPAATATSSATWSARWPRRRRRGVRAGRGLPRPPRGGALADAAAQRRRRVARDAPT